MSTAKEIMYKSSNASDAIKHAEEIAVDVDQEWETETTKYKFEDGSMLSVSGPCVSVESAE